MNKLGIFVNFWEKDWNVDYHKYIDKVADLGFDILEYQAQPLLDIDDARLREIRAYADARGITMTYSLGLDPRYDISSLDENVRAGGVRYLTDIMKKMHVMGGNVISGVSYAGWGAPNCILNDKRPLVEASVRSMKELTRVAGDLGITYCVETVNRFENALLNTAEEALAYVKAVDSPHIGILLDTYHMNIEEASIGDAIRLVGKNLYAFHTGENNRTPPGMGYGHLDWDEIFKALSEIGFKGQIVSEPFVMMGGEVGRDIKVYRNLLPDTSEAALDRAAKGLLDFTRKKLAQYGLA